MRSAELVSGVQQVVQRYMHAHVCTHSQGRLAYDAEDCSLCQRKSSYFIYMFIYFIYSSVYIGEGEAPHSSALAWKIPWAEEPGGLQSMGSLRFGHD